MDKTLHIVRQFSQKFWAIFCVTNSEIAVHAKPSTENIFLVAMIKMQSFGCWQRLAYFATQWFRSSRHDIVPPFSQICFLSAFVLFSPPFVVSKKFVSIGDISGSVSNFLAEPAIWKISIFTGIVCMKFIQRLNYSAFGTFLHGIH